MSRAFQVSFMKALVGMSTEERRLDEEDGPLPKKTWKLKKQGMMDGELHHWARPLNLNLCQILVTTVALCNSMNHIIITLKSLLM